MEWADSSARMESRNRNRDSAVCALYCKKYAEK